MVTVHVVLMGVWVYVRFDTLCKIQLLDCRYCETVGIHRGIVCIVGLWNCGTVSIAGLSVLWDCQYCGTVGIAKTALVMPLPFHFQTARSK